MAFTLENAIVELTRAIPAFEPDPEYKAEGLVYLIFNDFARFICSEAEVLQYITSEEEAFRLSSVPACMMFLKRALQEGDSAVRDLVNECLETLSQCPCQQQIRQWFDA